MDTIPPDICCKKCGSVNVRGARGQWGPHTERIECRDCRAVTWGFNKSIKSRALDLLADAIYGDAVSNSRDEWSLAARKLLEEAKHG